MAAPATIRALRRYDRAPLERHRRLLQAGEQGITRLRRGTQQQDPCVPATRIRTERRGIPPPQGPFMHASLAMIGENQPLDFLKTQKKFADLIKAALLASTTAAGKPIEIWFGDEARVGQKGTHAYVWAPIGSRPAMVRDVRHDSVHLFGARCTARDGGGAIIMPAVNAEAMNEHLKEISAQVAH